MRDKITKTAVERLRPGETLFDAGKAAVAGFCARRLPSGTVLFGFKYRDPATRKQRWLGLGRFPSVSPELARDLAKKAAGRVADGRDPQGERAAAREAAKHKAAVEGKTVTWLCDEFVSRYAEAQGLRSAPEIRRVLDVYVKPRLGRRSIYAVKRSQVVEMLDAVEDANGPVMAHNVLAWTRKMFAWQMSRDDDFRSPIARGMGRIRPKERARSRTFSDEEIRAFWAATAAPGIYGQLCRFLLATAQRRDEAAGTTWGEFEDDGVWLIPPARHKGKVPHAVPLNDCARAVLATLPHGDRDRYVFTTDKDATRPFSGFSRAKRRLDALMLMELKKAAERGGDGSKVSLVPWRLHDLRRTARSLMSRAGVPTDHAEFALGHLPQGVRSTYDRWTYLPEKTEAMRRLGVLLETILNPPAAPNVVPIRTSNSIGVNAS